jgi:hypothetical protein
MVSGEISFWKVGYEYDDDNHLRESSEPAGGFVLQILRKAVVRCLPAAGERYGFLRGARARRGLVGSAPAALFRSCRG